MQRLVSFKKDDVLPFLTWFPKYTFYSSSNIALFLILMMIQKDTFIFVSFPPFIPVWKNCSQRKVELEPQRILDVSVYYTGQQNLIFFCPTNFNKWT